MRGPRSDRASYESACLSCHGASPQVTCPVSSRQGCIECHMPKVVDEGQHVPWTDHWIRVRKELKSRDEPASRAEAVR